MGGDGSYGLACDDPPPRKRRDLRWRAAGRRTERAPHRANTKRQPDRRLAGHYLTGEVAGRRVTRLVFHQGRLDLCTHRLSLPAAGSEATARGRISRAPDVTFEDDLLPIG